MADLWLRIFTNQPRALKTKVKLKKRVGRVENREVEEMIGGREREKRRRN